MAIRYDNQFVLKPSRDADRAVIFIDCASLLNNALKPPASVARVSHKLLWGQMDTRQENIFNE